MSGVYIYISYTWNTIAIAPQSPSPWAQPDKNAKKKEQIGDYKVPIFTIHLS